MGTLAPGLNCRDRKGKWPRQQQGEQRQHPQVSPEWGVDIVV
ncbi:hypothetical protein [Streptomyces sp. NPDC010273]